MPSPPTIRKGRGAISNPEGRFESLRVEPVDDGWAGTTQLEGSTQPAAGAGETIGDNGLIDLAQELPPLETTIAPERAKSIITRNDSPDIPFEQSINPYRGCEHGCVYCLDGATRILLADGGCKPLGEIRVGDEIYGTQRRGLYRYYVKTRVLAHWQTRKLAYRVSLADGNELIASADHRFLTEHGWKFVARDDEESGRLALNHALMGFGKNLPREGLEGQEVRTAANLCLTAVEALDEERDLFDITTGTGDFIANGVVSHNCYARPMHSYVNLSPGLDFETKLFYKKDAAQLLDKELRRPKYVCKPINLGAATDPYQPIERKLRVTRSILEVLQKFRHPLTIVTKGHLVTRDIDILAEMARDNLVRVFVSVTTLDPALKRTLEPRAPAPTARLNAVRTLSDAKIPVGIMVAPIIPVVNDHEIEHILEAGVRSGAQSAGFTMLRLPYEVKDLFREWLAAHLPLRADHVMSLVQQMRGGRDNDPNFGSRMRGEGAYAQLIQARFEAACHRLGLNQTRRAALHTMYFRIPQPVNGQLNLL